MASSSITIKDQMGFNVTCPKNPQRIISLVPSQTELLFDLGLGDKIVGVTKFCVHPNDRVGQAAKIGGTKKFNFTKIKELNPDLIIGNKEENYKEGIEELKKRYPVWMSDIVTLEDSLHMMKEIGELTDSSDNAKLLVEKIRSGFALQERTSHKKALYLIWHSPHMAAGTETFINEMLGYAGFENLVIEPRYPELTDEQIVSHNPEYILLSSEPYPFKEQHIKIFQELCPKSEVILVDGEMFSWYGSRLKYASSYFEKFMKY